MRRGTIGRLPYWAIAVILAGLTIGLIFLGFSVGFGDYSFFFLAVPFGLAAWYMVEYSALDAAAGSSAHAAVPFPPEDAFEDPVVEADLFDSLNEADRDAVVENSPPPAP
ncbi:MAG: hypothetical protein ABSA15_07230 [Thermoplasmata archaeon]|jgi:hypothetical protein